MGCYQLPPSLYAATGARKYVNLSERAALLSVLAALPRDRQLFILTLIWSGARISEVLGVTRQSFQIEPGILSIRTLKRRGHAVREIPIPDFHIEELDEYFDIQGGQSDHSRASVRLWTFHRITGWRIIKTAMDAAGIHGVRATPRGLRHAFGVGALACGVPLNIVQRLLGHSSIKTTTIYTQACGPDERSIVARFWPPP